MPKRNDIKSILLIGSGPIVIGQACEFDYSGTQAIKALRAEGYRVILVNSNPATIMTDPEFADATYVEPITPEFVERIIAKERPDAVLPTMGGQTALNCTLELAERGVFERYGCELIGANISAIKTAEDRELFKVAMDEIGLESAKSGIVHSVKDAEALVERLGYPLILRPSRTLGGTGGGIVNGPSELTEKVSRALAASPNREVLVEESLLGWKEIELEVMRDLKDNVVIVCSIENFDPMGVHTGDSITVAPVQTLTDKEYQLLRDAAIKVIRRIGVETGGSNVQFAMNPKDGRIVIIEMNPRVSRSSALASKATGFPIAKIAAKLAVGYTLDEVQNDITKETPACFEPSIDYTVVKIPRFNFEKFPLSKPDLGTQMKSVGEVLSFGRNFAEALQKAICSMELDSSGFDGDKLVAELGKEELLELCAKPAPRRLWYVGEALRRGHSVETLYQVTAIDPWFLTEIAALIAREQEISASTSADLLTAEKMLALKKEGFSDRRIAKLMNKPEAEIRALRQEYGIKPDYLSVDTCAAEFKAYTPYHYSSFDSSVPGHSAYVAAASEAGTSSAKGASKNGSVIILGSGPNRIGQGIEFDYCCVHAVMSLKEEGYEAVMVNCNPETVSTDYDISDRLYFEPLTLESVLSIVEREKPKGVVVQFGGQTPLKLAGALAELGVPILGTSVESIDMAEDRERFSDVVKAVGLRQPEYAHARSLEEALAGAKKLGFPVIIRPSFVLGGRAMRVLFNEDDLLKYMAESVEVSNDRPVLMDRYLYNAVEVDVDAVSDGDEVLIAGVMEHIEPAGVHSGDSSCSLPPYSLSRKTIEELKASTRLLAKELKVVGLMNVQYAVTSDGTIYILEANPRASRTVPFVSKASGIPWAKIATKCMVGCKLKDLGVSEVDDYEYVSVKACVFPFSKFPGSDTVLGPEMKSTGEVMGIDNDFPSAFARSQYAANVKLPTQGKVFISVVDRDKAALLPIARKLNELGFELVATSGTASYLSEQGLKVEMVRKVREGSTHIVDLILAGQISMVINTPEGNDPLMDSRSIRLSANEMGIPTYTTIAAAASVVRALPRIHSESLGVVRCLQEWHGS